VANPGFATSLTGWRSGNSRTTLTRTCAVSHSGSCAAELTRTRSSGDVMLDDSPNTVASTTAGAVYTGVAWVRAPVGRSIRLRLRELNGGSLVRSRIVTVTGDGAWRQVVVSSAAASGGSALSVEILVSLARGSKAWVDDVSLRRT
jgi:hypothetical protein